MTAEQTLAGRAAAGAAMLDSSSPGWAQRADPGRLWMDNTWQCVLGQLYGGYHGGCNELGLDSAQAIILGFTLPPGSDPGTWMMLEAAWVTEIRGRREQARVTR